MTGRSGATTRMPRNSTLGLAVGAAAVGAALVQFNLQQTFAAVKHPVPLGAANLEADVQVVRGWYRILMEQGTYLQMVRTELVDLAWPLLLGATIVLIYRFTAGLLRTVHPPISAWLYRWAPIWAIGPVFDLLENGFSLAMLTDPFGFPDWWAVAHVAASWSKIVGSVAAAIVGPTLAVIALVTARRARKATDAQQALSPR